MFGNVNVDYKPCKSKVQLERAAHYILGKLPEQISEGIVKTAPNLYWGMNCDRDNFARDILMTRKLFGKRETPKTNLAFKMSISFSPDDNDKLSYDEVFRIAMEFAEKYFKGYEVLFAVHTDKPHKHVHFLIGNCHTETGKAYRRSQKDLYEMCEFFGEQCMQRGLTHSVRDSYFRDKENDSRDKETFAEKQIKAKGKETFKDELREVIRIECADPNNKTLEDVVAALMKHYHVECRVKGNTISYRHPEYTDKNGKLVSVRGSKLGDKYTVKGILHELEQIRRGRTDRDLAELSAAESEIAKNTTSVQSGRSSNNSGNTGQQAEGRGFIAGASTGGVRAGDNSGTDNSAGNRQHQGEGTSTVRSIGGEHAERQSGREGSSDGIGSSGDVRSFEDLFREYEQRNGTPERQRPANSEPARTVRKKRKKHSRSDSL